MDNTDVVWDDMIEDVDSMLGDIVVKYGVDSAVLSSILIGRLVKLNHVTGNLQDFMNTMEDMSRIARHLT